MYINARTKMEGWDVELVFRKMTQRIGAMAICLIFCLGSFASGQEDAEVDPQKVMQKVLQEDAFIIHTRTEKRYRYKGRSSSYERRDRSWRSGGRSSRGSRGSKGGGRAAGPGIDATFLGWIALGAVVAYILYLLGRVLVDRYGKVREFHEPKAETVLGMSVSRKSLPKDLLARARELWESGDTRGSLALLYRGTLSWLIYQGGVSIRESDTEIDCLQRCSESEGGRERADYFRALTSAWIKVAYGKEDLSEDEMRHLFDNWPNEKRNNKLMKSAVSLALVTMLSGCGNYEVEEETREIGYKGRAKVYPFLAVEKFLNEMSVNFERIYTFTEMPDSSSVILYPSEVDVRRDRAEDLLDWVSEGGSIVYMLEGADSFSKWTFEDIVLEDDDEDKEEKKKESYPFLDELGVKSVDSVADRESVKWGSRTYQWQLQESPGFKIPQWMWKDAKGHRVGENRKSVSVIRLSHGAGVVTLVGQAKPWRNRYVGEGDHVSVLWDILNMGKQSLETVWLVRGSRASFWDLLVKYAWMPLLSLVVYVVIWLWKSIPGFGPMIPDEPEGSRDFNEHLLMTGRFFVRKDMTGTLIEPVQKAIGTEVEALPFKRRRRFGGRMGPPFRSDRHIRKKIAMGASTRSATRIKKRVLPYDPNTTAD